MIGKTVFVRTLGRAAKATVLEVVQVPSLRVRMEGSGAVVVVPQRSVQTEEDWRLRRGFAPKRAASGGEK